MIPIPQSFIRLEKARQKISITSRVRRVNPEASPRSVPLYSGMSLPTVIAMNGGDPKSYRQLLLENQVGSVYDIEDGSAFLVPQVRQENDFAVHPYA